MRVSRRSAPLSRAKRHAQAFRVVVAEIRLSCVRGEAQETRVYCFIMHRGTTVTENTTASCDTDRADRADTAGAGGSVAITAARYCLTGLSDEEVLVGTRSLVGHSNRMLAALLAHLAEVEARGIHRIRACASLYTYCLYELRMSEDAAFRRARAARIAREYPLVLERVAAGEIHLTGLLMLGPHLTEQNHREVLQRAKFRSKREIAALVRQLNPLPSVPPLVEPLGPESAGDSGPGISAPPHATWGAFMQALAGPVRELPEGQRPSDWCGDEADQRAAIDRDESHGTELPRAAEPSERSQSGNAVGGASATSELDVPQRYRVEFTATQEYVDLLRQAQDLLSHAVPRRALDVLHLRAMRALVAELRRQKCAARREGRRNAAATKVPHAEASRASAGSANGERSRASAGARNGERAGGSPKASRHVPAAVRHAVWERDHGRCTYVSPAGERCRETACLELHHEEAYARGGASTTDNIRLLCRSHNALEAEQEFGRELVRAKVLEHRPEDQRQRGCDWRSGAGCGR
jgi:5-methylcytosine-specific restriction endonuclease McrA